jgi:hypothetical protein
MIEGETLFKYSGEVSSTWAWSQVGTVIVDQNSYTYKWVLPIGTSTIDTSKFVVQTQGYSQPMNVFSPCPVSGGGPNGAGRYCA